MHTPDFKWLQRTGSKPCSNRPAHTET